VSEPSWQPIDEHEQKLWRARMRGDQEGYLRQLVRAALLLPLLPTEAAGHGPVSWVSSEVSGQRCVLAFTSREAMRRALGGDPAYRPARFLELAATWPDPSAWLAVNPGLPIEVYLTSDIVAELAALAAQPRTELEEDLLTAASGAGDVRGYVARLQASPVLLPVPTRTDVEDITDPAFVWWRADGNAGPIPAFTSADRLRDQLGDQRYVEVSFDELPGAWPDPATDLVIDPGAAHCVVLPGGMFRTPAAK
jgi:hypothetical protein